MLYNLRSYGLHFRFIVRYLYYCTFSADRSFVLYYISFYFNQYNIKKVVRLLLQQPLIIMLMEAR